MRSFSLVVFAVGVLFFVASLSTPSASPSAVFHTFVAVCVVLAFVARCSSAIVAFLADVLMFLDGVADE